MSNLENSLDESEVTESAIKSILTVMLSNINDNSVTAYKEVSIPPTWRNALDSVKSGDLDNFYYQVLFPFEEYFRGMLTAEISTKSPVQFLLLNYNFVEGHFQTMYSRYEGGPCCADKSRWAMRALFNYFDKATPITIDLTAKYTFHYPKQILNAEQSILGFFNGLMRLFYGEPDAYLKEVLAINVAASAAKDASKN